jgi:L-serine/L-threonine ammonia-lyase
MYGSKDFFSETDLKMQKLHSVTPVWESYLPHRNKVLYKMEALQAPGSFKIRGIGRLCIESVRNGATNIVASSGGNAGLAASYAGKSLNVPVTVFVPKTTGERMREGLRRLDATVIEHGEVWDETHLCAVDYANSHNAAYVHPFDHPLIWEGHSTMIEELSDSNIKPKNIVLSVGGGGLLLGVLCGLEKLNWRDVNVFAVETSGAASLNASLEKNRIVTLPSVQSIANSLGARTVSNEALKKSLDWGVQPVIVSDKEAIDAVIRFADEKRILVEPACGASLAVTYEKQSILPDGDTLVIVCGGSGVTLEQLDVWKKML